MADNTIDINKKTLVDNVSENAAMLVSDHGKLVRYPIKKISGNRIFSYALGYGKDVEAGSYKMDTPPFELIENGIDYDDIIVDTDGGCIFQYVASIGDGDATLQGDGLLCIANTNGAVQEGAMVFKGIVDSLPENASEGDVYTVTAECIGTGKFAVSVSGIKSVVQDPKEEWGDFDGNTFIEIDDSALLHKALQYCLYGMYGEYGLNFDSYFYKEGKKYPIPWVTTCSHTRSTGESGILINTNSDFNSLLKNGNTIIFEFGNTSYLSNDVAQCAVKYPANTSFHYTQNKWVAFDSDVIIDLLIRIKSLEKSGNNENAPMVFKDVVDALPETANEGEVYALKGPVDINNPKWIQVADAARVGDQFNMTEQGSNIVITNPSETIVDVIKDIINTYGGVPTLIKVEGLFYNSAGGPDNPYTVGCEAACNIVSTDFSYEDYREYGGPLMVNIPVEMVSFKGNEYGDFGCEGHVNIYTATRPTTSHIRHNGEWIPLVN